MPRDSGDELEQWLRSFREGSDDESPFSDPFNLRKRDTSPPIGVFGPSHPRRSSDEPEYRDLFIHDGDIRGRMFGPPPLGKSSDEPRSPDAGSSPLRCDHVWSWAQGWRRAGAIAVPGAHGDPRGFWLVLTQSYELQLFRASGPRFKPSMKPSFSAPNPAATKAKKRGRNSFTMVFGNSVRTVMLSGREKAPLLSLGLPLLGEPGHFMDLTLAIKEGIEGGRRMHEIRNAWSRILLS
jgi:hypothetical protein